MFGRAKIAEITAEFLGAGFLTYALLGALTKQALPAPWAFGLIMAGGILWFGRIAKCHFNPAITIGFWTTGKIKTIKAILYIVAQIVGAYAAIQLFQWVTGNPISAQSPDYSTNSMVSELIGTFVLAFAFAAAVYKGLDYKQKAMMVGVGAALGVLVGGAAAVGFLNPGIALVTLGVGSGVWGIYVVGSIIGAIVAINVYALLFDDGKTSFRSALKKVDAKASKATAKSTTVKKTTPKKVAPKKRVTKK